MSAKKLNEQNFEQEVLKQDLALVDFYADWCGPCKMMAPIIDAIANERQDITIGKVNVDENPVLSSQYKIMTIPTIIVFKNGEIANQISGLRSKDQLLDLLKQTPYLVICECL